MSELHIKPVENIYDAVYISQVRNSGREYMTHDSRLITQGEQNEWYQKTYLPENAAGNMFAFCGFEQGDPVAYGMVKRGDDGNFWLTGVVVPDAQGKGYGKELFQFLTDYALSKADKVMLDVLKSNDKAQGLYKKLGYQAVGKPAGEVIVMERNR
jgi:ribosomal protein S18 acetylase RimI-like enzyme